MPARDEYFRKKEQHIVLYKQNIWTWQHQRPTTRVHRRGQNLNLDNSKAWIIGHRSHRRYFRHEKRFSWSDRISWLMVWSMHLTMEPTYDDGITYNGRFTLLFLSLWLLISIQYAGIDDATSDWRGRGTSHDVVQTLIPHLFLPDYFKGCRRWWR